MVTSESEGEDETGLIMGIDVGTTRIKICLYTAEKLYLFHHQEEQVDITQGMIREIEAKKLWIQLCSLIKSEIAYSKINGKKILGIGLSCQRNTFISWNKCDLEPCHNFIVWDDRRSKDFCRTWNNSFLAKIINLSGIILSFITRSERYKAAKIFRMKEQMVAPRFLVTLKKNEKMKSLISQEKLAFGCLETWLILKLTSGKVFTTTYSNVSSTGLFDPFLGNWGTLILSLIKFPRHVLPTLIQTNSSILGTIDEQLFGTTYKIASSLGDSQADVLGSGCSATADLKISLGTGTFIAFITEKPYVSLKEGVYPLVAWKLNDKSTYMIEGNVNQTAGIIDWALSSGFMESVEESTLLAINTEPDENLFFVYTGRSEEKDKPSFGFLGITHQTTRIQMLRALLESIVFSIFDVSETLILEMNISNSTDFKIRCCGGVSQNDFICQQIANLFNRKVERVENPQYCSTKGAAILAAVNIGLCTLEESLRLHVRIAKFFNPVSMDERKPLLRRYESWKRLQKSLLSIVTI